MSRTLQFKRYGSATLANTIGANGELIINTTNKTLTVHDGITPGGFTLLNEAVEMDIDQYARNTANSATSNITIIQGVNVTQNTNITNTTNLAQNAYNRANSANSLAQSAYNYANTLPTTSIDSFARNTANGATTLAQSAYNYANTIVSDTQIDPYARTTANTASDNITIIQGVNITQNTNITNLSSNISLIDSINSTQNTNITNVTNLTQAAFNQANSANSLAQAAFNQANTGVQTYANSNVISLLSSFGSNNITTTGNVTASRFIGDGSALSNVTANIANIAGNIVGTQPNVTLVAGSYDWTFDNTGTLTLPGNTFDVKYNNGTQVDIVTRFEGSWNVATGNSTVSFTVNENETYYMWVEGNIPNGIITWNATATITNTNVPVVGAQYAWVYSGGGTPIDFTSLPNQFIGTANTIVRSSAAPSTTTNRFDFGINNTSGSAQTVRYGWVKIS